MARSSTYVDDRYADIASGLMQYHTREEILEAYGLSEDATDSDIGYQAVLWGDANPDGSLN